MNVITILKPDKNFQQRTFNLDITDTVEGKYHIDNISEECWVL